MPPFTNPVHYDDVGTIYDDPDVSYDGAWLITEPPPPAETGTFEWRFVRVKPRGMHPYYERRRVRIGP